MKSLENVGKLQRQADEDTGWCSGRQTDRRTDKLTNWVAVWQAVRLIVWSSVRLATGRQVDCCWPVGWLGIVSQRQFNVAHIIHSLRCFLLLHVRVICNFNKIILFKHLMTMSNKSWNAHGAHPPSAIRHLPLAIHWVLHLGCSQSVWKYIWRITRTEQKHIQP